MILPTASGGIIPSPSFPLCLKIGPDQAQFGGIPI
jgi:hypothetical protein